MNFNFSHVINSCSAEAKFFKSFAAREQIMSNELDSIYANAPESVILLHKDKDLRYVGMSQALADIEGADRPEDLFGITDYEMPKIEYNKTADSIREEDKACMAGTYTKSCYGGMIKDICGNPVLMILKKLPVTGSRGTLGSLAVALNATQAFLDTKQEIINENVPLPYISPHDKVTKRQLEVIKLYNQGYSRKRAARRLNITELTYAWHLRKIREKFNIRTRTEMLMLEQHFE